MDCERVIAGAGPSSAPPTARKPGAAPRPPRLRNNAQGIDRSTPVAALFAIAVDPTMALPVAMAWPLDVRPTDHRADHATDDRAGGSGDEEARARADGGAFHRSGLGRALGYDRHDRQGEREQSSLEYGAHDKSPWVKTIEASAESRPAVLNRPQ